MYNLFLEIATVDRSEVSLRFDNRLRDFDFFRIKTMYIVQSKLEVFFRFLKHEDINVSIESICDDAEKYKRIRIWKFY